jgi:hypothetical protein
MNPYVTFDGANIKRFVYIKQIVLNKNKNIFRDAFAKTQNMIDNQPFMTVFCPKLFVSFL